MGERSNRGRFTVEAFSREDPALGMQLVTRAPTWDVAVDAAINAMFDTDIQVSRVIDRRSRQMVFRLDLDTLTGSLDAAVRARRNLPALSSQRD